MSKMSKWSDTMTSDFTLYCTPKPGWKRDQQISISTNRHLEPRIILWAEDEPAVKLVTVALTPSEARILISQLTAAISIAEEEPNA